MSLSKSKCCYSNNCLQFLERAVPLITALKSFIAQADDGREKEKKESILKNGEKFSSLTIENLLNSNLYRKKMF
jgi:hypothetical protein